MTVNANWAISFSPDDDAGAYAYGAYHNQDLIGADDYTTSAAGSYMNVTGTGIAQGPDRPLIVAGLSPPPNAYAVTWKTSGGYDPPPTIYQMDRPPPTSIPISFKLTEGVPTHVYWVFDVASGAQVVNDDLTPGFGTAHSFFDFTHTANWGGITSVIDADTGEPVTDWTMDSASGFDYVHPFAEPEPASIVLAAFGAIAFAVVARRKSTAQNRA
jgi:hypothetical protein